MSALSVLAAQAQHSFLEIPYDTVSVMDKINGDFPEVGVLITVGASDAANQAAQEMSECLCWNLEMVLPLLL